MKSKEVIRPTIDKVVVFTVLFALLPLIRYQTCVPGSCSDETGLPYSL